eukprot:4207421-Amphidinium_carterae.1
MTKVFYCSVHPVDPATFACFCLPSLSVAKAYNKRCLLTKVALFTYLTTRSEVFPAGTASVSIAYKFLVQLSMSSELFVIGSTEIILDIARLNHSVNMMKTAASVDASYYGVPSAGLDVKRADEVLSMVKTYANVTKRCMSLASSPRVKSCPPADAAFESRCKALAVATDEAAIAAALSVVRGDVGTATLVTIDALSNAMRDGSSAVFE